MNYKKDIINLIADKTGIEPEEINEDSFIEDDLNLGEMELIEVIEAIEDKYDVELMEVRDNFETIGDILDQMAENLD